MIENSTTDYGRLSDASRDVVGRCMFLIWSWNVFYRMSIFLTKSLVISPRVQKSHQESKGLTKSPKVSPRVPLSHQVRRHVSEIQSHQESHQHGCALNGQKTKRRRNWTALRQNWKINLITWWQASIWDSLSRKIFIFGFVFKYPFIFSAVFWIPGLMCLIEM